MEVYTSVLIFLSIHITANADRSKIQTFSEDFIFGAATSSYQIEGAWNEGGKGWSMWDHLVHNDPGYIADNTTGDDAAKSYYLYKRDVEMLKELGVKAYRFSISWPRILPSGRPDYVNQIGIAYYNALIDELLANNIEPFVTMYHWELPQNLSERGGWLNEEVVNWFGDYARVLYQEFGDKVKHWLTLNEPYIHCYRGYGMAFFAPKIFSPGEGYYECGRNYLLAHARAYHIYYDEFKSQQGGEIGYVISMDWPVPATDKEEDIEAAQDFIAFNVRHYADPIYSKQGNYPQRLIDMVAVASLNQGLNASRLRPFSEEEINYMRGTADFLALNHYTSKKVYRNSSVGSFIVPSVDDDLGVMSYGDDSWPNEGSRYYRDYAPGFYQLLLYLKKNYDNVAIYITENGISGTTGLNDLVRTQYIRNYLNAVLDALSEGVNVKGYFFWSLMDNFEWTSGYTLRFGLFEVDMNDPNRTRTPRKSAYVYKEIVKTRVIDLNYDPDPYAQTKSATASRPSIITLIILGVTYLLQ